MSDLSPFDLKLGRKMTYYCQHCNADVYVNISAYHDDGGHERAIEVEIVVRCAVCNSTLDSGSETVRLGT